MYKKTDFIVICYGSHFYFDSGSFSIVGSALLVTSQSVSKLWLKREGYQLVGDRCTNIYHFTNQYGTNVIKPRNVVCFNTPRHQSPVVM